MMQYSKGFASRFRCNDCPIESICDMINDDDCDDSDDNNYEGDEKGDDNMMVIMGMMII